MTILKNNSICPLVENPEPECYCVDLTSRSIRLILNYCKVNYKRCDVYVKKGMSRLGAQRKAG